MEEREARMRQENLAMKRIDKSRELTRMTKQEEFQKEQLFKQILEKDQKISEFK